MRDNNQPTDQKKPYTPPVLTEYGEVAKLTESQGNSLTDDHGQNHMFL